MSIKSFFHDIGDKIALIFGHTPKDWLEHTDEVIAFGNKLKAFLVSPATLILSSLIPHGWGNIAREDIIKIINDTLPEIEMAHDVLQAIEGVTDPEQKANIILKTILDSIGKLPQDWQGKHWLDIARKLLTALTGMSNTEANVLINIKYGQLKSTNR